jgi:alpha-1,2-mannosyltransferase
VTSAPHDLDDSTLIEPLTPTSPLRKRLWLGGAGLVVFLLTLVVGNFTLPRDKRLTSSMVGHDFLVFYTAGQFLNEGRPLDLYDLEKVSAGQRAIAEQAGLDLSGNYGPFWYPPFYAQFFRPFAALPYHRALLVWELTNVACLVRAIALLVRFARPRGWRTWALIPLLLCTSMPFIQAMTHAQNTMISLLLLASVIALWRADRAFGAGLVAGLLFYKPQLAAVIAAALVLTKGWRALAGVAIPAACFLLIALVTLPGTLTDYLARMPVNLRQFQVLQPYLWDRHVNLRAFWRLLIQGTAAGEMTLLTKACWLGSASALGLMLVRAAWLRRRERNQDALIIATVTAMPLLMPFYLDYDLLLVATAAVLFAMTRRADEHRLTRVWVALFAWLMVNATVARLTHVNGTVILLSGVAFCAARRAAKLASTDIQDLPLGTDRPPLATAA